MDLRQFDFINQNHPIVFTYLNWVQLILWECCCVCIVNRRLRKLTKQSKKRLSKDLDIVWLIQSVKQLKAFMKGRLMTKADRLIAKNALANCIYVDESEEEHLEKERFKDVFR